MKKSALTIAAGAALSLLLTIPAGAAVKANNKAEHTSVQSSWPAETLGGTIGQVQPGQHMVVIETQGNVPFDMTITPKTRIRHDNQAISLQDLSQYKKSQVTVHFIPERKGDVAESIQING